MIDTPYGRYESEMILLKEELFSINKEISKANFWRTLERFGLL